MEKRDFIKKLGSLGLAAVASKFSIDHLYAPKALDVSKFHNASFYSVIDQENIQCLLCPHHCVLGENRTGKCMVRRNMGGKMIALGYGRTSAINVDPIEKKPFFHFLPGTEIFSIGTWGCNFSCSFCQNHSISQPEDCLSSALSMVPDEIVIRMKEENQSILAFTYNEPLVNFEYLYDTLVLAKSFGFRTALVSNGYIEPEPLEMLIPLLDAANIDFKFLDNSRMNEFCAADSTPVLRTLQRFNNSAVHLEITTLLIPEIHGSLGEAKAQFRWLLDNGFAEVPLHLSRFSPHYRMRNCAFGDHSEVLQIREVAKNMGLKFVYSGNLGPDFRNNTICPNCKQILIFRRGYSSTHSPFFRDNGSCAHCGYNIKGIWG